MTFYVFFTAEGREAGLFGQHSNNCREVQRASGQGCGDGQTLFYRPDPFVLAKLGEHRIKSSMNQRGSCYDNAVVESFFKTLKAELVRTVRFDRIEDARVKLFEFIEVFYNRKRLHSSLGYKSPVEYEAGTTLN